METFWLNTFKSPNSPYPPDSNASLNLEAAASKTNAGRTTIQDVTVTTDTPMSKSERNARTHFTYDTDTELDISVPPLAHRRGRDGQPLGSRRIGRGLRTGQNHAGTLYKP